MDEESPKGWLPQHHVLYVADIHGMPSFIARMFAIPSMQKRPYPMLLDRDGAATARFPSEEGKATLLFLEDRVHPVRSLRAPRTRPGQGTLPRLVELEGLKAD